MKLCFYKAKKKNRSEICCRFLQTIGLGSSKENSGTLLTSLPPQMQQRLLLSNFYLFYPFCFFFYIFLHILKYAAKVATVSNFYIFYPVFTYCYKLLHILKFSKGFYFLVSPMLTYSIQRFHLRW